jgi:hypothetical protein
MPDPNADVPGNIALVVETIALLLHTTLLDGFDLRILFRSVCFSKCPSQKISSVVHTLLGNF